MRRRFLYLLGGFVFFLIAILGFSLFSSPTVHAPSTLHPLTLHPQSGADIPLQVEWASTEQEREYGLMNRSFLDHGMLFIFQNAQPMTFWMKNTLVPLDIVFFDANRAYISSTTMQPCVADPCTLYPSAEPAQYALEMPAGFLQKTPVGKGWTMSSVAPFPTQP